MPAEPPETVLPIGEETLRVEKLRREAGRVRVSVRAGTVEEVVRETLRGRSAELERVPVGREVGQAPAMREEDGVLIIPVVEEILVIEKRLVLKEEIRIRFNETEDVVEKTVQRRVEHAVIERVYSGEDEAKPTE
jgi:stress response protein YsnF